MSRLSGRTISALKMVGITRPDQKTIAEHAVDPVAKTIEPKRAWDDLKDELRRES